MCLKFIAGMIIIPQWGTQNNSGALKIDSGAHKIDSEHTKYKLK